MLRGSSAERSSYGMDGDDGGWEEVPARKAKREKRRQAAEQRRGGGGKGGGGQRGQRGQRGYDWGLPAPARRPAPLTVIVLVGTPGCGKSTFCDALNSTLSSRDPAFPLPVRISQDDLGGRPACESLTEAALAGGHNVVIDRCNFDESQRQHWLRIGARHGATIVAAFLNTPIRLCKERVAARRNHPTLGPGRESMQIVERFRHMLRPPTQAEGFSLIVEASEAPASVHAAAATLAAHLQSAMQSAAPAAAAPPRSYSMQAMEGLLSEPLSAEQHAAVSHSLAEHAWRAPAPEPEQAAQLPRSPSGEERARLEGELRALNHFAAMTGAAPEAAAAWDGEGDDADARRTLLHTQGEITRLRCELGLGQPAPAPPQAAGGGGVMRADAPAWGPPRA